jgi:hypothetical protein
MTAAMITQLILMFGPQAIQLIQQLTALWSKPALTLDEVNSLCNLAQTSYDTYIANAKAALAASNAVPAPVIVAPAAPAATTAANPLAFKQPATSP